MNYQPMYKSLAALLFTWPRKSCTTLCVCVRAHVWERWVECSVVALTTSAKEQPQPHSFSSSHGRRGNTHPPPPLYCWRSHGFTFLRHLFNVFFFVFFFNFGFTFYSLALKRLQHQLHWSDFTRVWIRRMTSLLVIENSVWNFCNGEIKKTQD